MAITNAFYHKLPYTHEELEKLFAKLVAGELLKPEDYDKLVNVIGINNISTFSGKYDDLENKPSIPYYISDLYDDLGLDTRDDVNRKINDAVETLVMMINEYENDSELEYAKQTALDNLAETLQLYTDVEIESAIKKINLTGFATKTALNLKADEVHEHELKDINGLEVKLGIIEGLVNAFYDHSTKYEHIHRNEEVLDKITQEKMNAWDDFLENTFEALALKADIIHEHDLLYASKDDEHNHSNKVILDALDAATLNKWDDAALFLGNRTESGTVLNRWFEGRPTTKEVGGIAYGCNLDGKGVRDILEMMLYPDEKPELSVALNTNPKGTVFEIGDTTTVVSVVATVKRTSNNIEVVTLYRNGEKLAERTGAAIAGGATITFEINEKISESIPEGFFSVEVRDVKGYVVKANVPAINFYYPIYYGVVEEAIEVTDITEAMILKMSKHVGEKGNKTFTYNTNNQRMVVAYPATYGDLVSILDLNGFEQIRAFERNQIIVEGLAYYVYANNANTNSNFKMTYKF